MRSIGILGCGLIGGSMLKALASSGAYSVCAFDPNPETVEHIRHEWPNVTCDRLPESLLTATMAEADHIAATLRTEAPTFVEQLATCDIVVLAGPVSSIVPTARVLTQITAALITDTASVKESIGAQLADLRFIGGHPMAGSEREGYIPARADMFQNAPYILVPNAHTSEEDIQALEQLAIDLGASPIQMSGVSHDQAVAYVSHLPHVVATALVLAVSRQDSSMMPLSAGGFRDITRIASANPELWAQICLGSKAHLIPAIDALLEELHAFRNHLETADKTALRDAFTNGFKRRSELPMHGLGALQADQAVNVFLNDVPGALADITKILADKKISIRNLSIQNARAYEGGQLRVYVADGSTADRCRAALKGHGYVCE